ncbi:MAG TPA: hypothetical protein VLI42_06240 [Chthoniobacterales bacterium]|nr:hypothetical protein [Chthoniobacterales bacterium]
MALSCGLLLYTSAVAGPVVDRDAASYQDVARKQKAMQQRVVYYVLTSASAIPRPISYVIGGLMTTPTPIQIIGRGETVTR